LATEYEVRKQAKLENRRYYDTAMMNFQVERIPEPIRVKPVQVRIIVEAKIIYCICIISFSLFRLARRSCKSTIGCV
jgi:hypothetical protein